MVAHLKISCILDSKRYAVISSIFKKNYYNKNVKIYRIKEIKFLYTDDGFILQLRYSALKK